MWSEKDWFDVRPPVISEDGWLDAFPPILDVGFGEGISGDFTGP